MVKKWPVSYVFLNTISWGPGKMWLTIHKDLERQDNRGAKRVTLQVHEALYYWLSFDNTIIKCYIYYSRCERTHCGTFPQHLENLTSSYRGCQSDKSWSFYPVRNLPKQKKKKKKTDCSPAIVHLGSLSQCHRLPEHLHGTVNVVFQLWWVKISSVDEWISWQRLTDSSLVSILRLIANKEQLADEW